MVVGLFYNVAGAVLWVASLVLDGWRNFSLVIVAIIGPSILPGLIEVWRQRRVAGSGAR